MPLKKCGNGWKWGDSGKCYEGPDAKKKAIKQGLVIEGPEKFSQKASEDCDHFDQTDIEYSIDQLGVEYPTASFRDVISFGMTLGSIPGWTEELSESNFIVPSEDQYVDFEEEDQDDYDAASLWENIRKKKEREGKKYRPAKPGDKDRPSPDAWKRAQSLWQKTFAEYEEGQMQREQLMKMHQQLMEIEQELDGIRFEDWTKDMISKSEIYIQNIYDFVEAHKGGSTEAKYIYEDQKTGEQYTYTRMGNHKKDGRTLIYIGKATEAEVEPVVEEKKKGKKHSSFVKKDQVTAPPTMTWAAEYKGRKVTLNKPFRTPDGPKKFAVYTKNQSGNVVIVRFGDPNMEIKRDNPKRRKSFRARHNCANPGPKWKARYWSCKKW